MCEVDKISQNESSSKSSSGEYPMILEELLLAICTSNFPFNSASTMSAPNDWMAMASSSCFEYCSPFVGL